MALHDAAADPVVAADAVDQAVPHSATLAINEKVRARLADGIATIHLGFGEAGLPAAPELVERLAAAAAANDYRPSAGSEPFRSAVAGHFERRGIPTTADQIVGAPGSKALLFALLRVLRGDVILPAPSWVSYAAQAAVAGKQVGWARIPDDCGGVPDPDALRDTVRAMRLRGDDPRILVLTVPDNPTGTVADAETVSAVAAVADSEGLAIIADEIYRDLAYVPGTVPSPVTDMPDRTFITSGLSKNLALGGWRVGFARFPDSDLGRAARRAVTGIASELWSSTPAPIEDAATWAMAEPAVLRERVKLSRRLHSTVARAVHGIFIGEFALCRMPTAAFYLYPDLSALSDELARIAVDADDVAVAAWLLDHHGVAMLPGSAFGDDPSALRFRVSTSLLYGRSTEQREAALTADDPLALPWIAEALARLRDIFGGIASA